MLANDHEQNDAADDARKDAEAEFFEFDETDDAAGSEEVDAMQQEIDALRQKAAERDEAEERLLRTAADFENRRKRVEREAENRIRYAIQDLLNDLLPVFDDLARAVKAAEEAPGGESIVEGIRIVEKHFYGALAKHGVHPIECVGEKFDPNRQEAITVMPRDDVPENTVIEEAQRGWTLGDRVIRAARVIVSAKPSE